MAKQSSSLPMHVSSLLDVQPCADRKQLLLPLQHNVMQTLALCIQVSKKKYIYTIDDDCFVAKTPSGESINALEQHIRNLLTPSTPRFFNTLYDPFAEGTDFVRGYPFSWRHGAPTAVSHGELVFSRTFYQNSAKAQSQPGWIVGMRLH